MTDLGSLQLMATLQHEKYYRIPAGDMYSFWWYWIGNQPTNMFSLNHETGVVTPTVRGSVGRPYSSIMHPTNHLVYLGIYGGSAESPIVTFNLSTGEYTYLHAGPSYSTADGGPQYDGPTNGSITWSDEPHKRIFFHGAIRSGLWAWDPTYDPLDPAGFQVTGIIDNPGTHTVRYGLSMQVSATHAFLPIYTSATGLSYLAMVRLSDGALTVKWKGSSITAVTVERGRWDEKIYISTKIGTAAEVWYDSDNLDTPLQTPPDRYPGLLRQWYIEAGYAKDTTLAIPDGTGDLTIPLNYKKPGDTDYRTVYTELLDVTPYGISNAGLDLDNNIVCFAENDGPTTKLVTADNTKTAKGFVPGLSGYSVGPDYHRRLEFWGGYSAQAYQYDPALPFVVGSNPHPIILARMTTDPIHPVGGARAYWSCDRMVDGNIWWVAEWRRVTAGIPNSLVQPR